MFSQEPTKLETKEKEYPYDALLVLGAVMEWDKFRNIWDFPPIIERYTGKLVMGKVRAFAASLLSESAPVVLVTGGSDVHPETGKRVSRSIELTKLMTGVYQIPKDKVVPMGTAEASHTLGNAENLIQYIEGHPETLKQKRIAILSPRFQVERAKMMFETNPYFQEHGIVVEWLIAEDEIEKRFPEMKEYFDWIYSTPEAEVNRQMERKGIEDLKGGGYKPVS